MISNFIVIVILCFLILLCYSTGVIIDTDDYWYNLVPKLASDLPTLCPVTKLLNVSADGFLGYPFELFGTTEWNIDNNLYTCKGIDESLNGAADMSRYRDGTNNYHCTGTSSGFCPIKVQNIQSTLSAIKWKLRPQICQLHDTMLSQSSAVKVLVLGGSLAQGIGTYGCCCKLDKFCPIDTILHVDCPWDRDDINSGSCSWPHYFARYLKKVYPSSIELINLSRGGQTSVLTLLQWDELMGSIKLTKNDIVLIDYSVNDEVSYGNRLNEVEFALEGIVRKLLAAGDDSPTIFILEMYPVQPIRYTEPYRKVAAHYKLPIISYYENVYSDFMNTTNPTFNANEVNPRSKESLLFQHGYSDGRHPPFWTHIYYADLIASSIQILSQHCLHMRTPNLLRPPKIESAINLHDNNISKSIDILHPFQQGTYFCLANSHIDFHIDACQEMMSKVNDSNHDVNTVMMINSQCHHINASAITNSDAYSLKGFQLKIESKGKPGFIYETLPFYSVLNSTSTETNADNDLTISINGGLLRGDGKIKIGFLKTYSNAGLFEVYACNTSLGIVDSLWHDDNEILSITQTAVFLACDIHIKCANQPFPYIKIKPIIATDRIEKRLQQKVKIVSVSMCSRDQQCHHGITDSINIV